MVNAPLRLISLGAGVQSSTMLFMTLTGDLPPADGAIFADTQDEPPSVYNWLEYLKDECAKVSFPLYVVTRGRLRDAVLDATQHVAGIPVFVRTEKSIDVATAWEPCAPCLEFGADESCSLCHGEGRVGVEFEHRGVEVSQGLAGRRCTDRYKMRPVEAKERELAGLPTPYRHPADAPPIVHRLLGISTDEVHRMKVNRIRWIRNEYPLIDARMTRHDCLRWMETNGYPRPPRSACVYCPYHSNDEWRRLRDDEPEAFAEAVEFDHLMRSTPGNLRGVPYVHRDMVPLDEVDLSTEEDRGQGSLFGNECEGMCGL